MGDVITRIGGAPIVFVICLIPVVATWIQSGLFLRNGLGEAKRIGMDQTVIKKVMTNTAIFTIMPTLPIIITMGPLMRVLGRYIPWLRLSVVGNAAYESIAADLALKSYGLGALGEATITEPAFVTIVLAMTLGIMTGPIMNTLFLKKYDTKIKSVSSSSESGFAQMGFMALFVGLVSVLSVPIAVNVKDPVGILTVIVSGIVVLALEHIAKKTGKTIIQDFAFPLAMLAGMLSALIWSRLF